MKGKCAGKIIAVFALLVISLVLLNFSGCARDQKLVGIQLEPNNVTFGGVGATVQFKAIGTYIHPPQDKDVTALATWSIDSQNLVQFNSTPGNVTAINDCGTGNVTASIQQDGNYVFGTAFVSAAGVGTSVCNQAVLTVVISGNGTVTSAPSGINCPSGACSAAFPLDSAVTLTGAPRTGATTVVWTWPTGSTGCQTTTQTTCSLPLDTNQTITATFQ
jgi:hypothetical protein